MTTGKSVGVTQTERMLAEFCERSFLKLWSYANPQKDDGHELCDLLAVFGRHVFIFFDREKALAGADEAKDFDTAWKRWKRGAIDDQIKTAHGAERYIRRGQPIYIDPKRTKPFPIPIDRANMIVHKIIVAHGAAEACKGFSPDNVSGSLAIRYSAGEPDESVPFMVGLDKEQPVHVFDSHNLPIILGELDTVADFARYLDTKLEAIAQLDYLIYCGEEDLLAHYYASYDKDEKRHIIVPNAETLNGMMVAEGQWEDFARSETYKNTKREDEVSYVWDAIIQRTCVHAEDGTLMGHTDLWASPSAILEMAKEPRFVRRAIADRMGRMVRKFPDKPGKMTRSVSLFPSFYEGTAYVFLQVRTTEELRRKPEYRQVRQSMLEIACGAAKNKYPELKKIVGIAIDAAKFVTENSEDFILMNVESWSDEQRAEYEEANSVLQFFGTPHLTAHHETFTQFVPPAEEPRPAPPKPSVRHYGKGKVGRNELCPCGSTKKFKKCHGA